jgi:hypothetical protein
LKPSKQGRLGVRRLKRYEISASVVIIWAQRWEATGSIAAKPSGGSTSPLEEHAEFLLGLISKQPDLTLDEIVAAMDKRRIAGSRSAVWRFFDRRNISFKNVWPAPSASGFLSVPLAVCFNVSGLGARSRAKMEIRAFRSS